MVVQVMRGGVGRDALTGQERRDRVAALAQPAAAAAAGPDPDAVDPIGGVRPTHAASGQLGQERRRACCCRTAHAGAVFGR